MADQRQLTPEVDAAYEFLEIMNDFTDSRELIREAISNSYDAGANLIQLDFIIDQSQGRPRLKTIITDDGEGMLADPDRNNPRTPNLKAFFNLGSSTRRTYDSTTGAKVSTGIGNKGHGTKIYLNCEHLKVITRRGDTIATGEVYTPKAELYNGRLPKIAITTRPVANGDIAAGTVVEVTGYVTERARFEHEKLKDYILWFTRHGSPERLLGTEIHAKRVVRLRGVGRAEPEDLTFGHIFPPEKDNVTQLKKDHPGEFSKYFVKRWAFKTQPLLDHPDLKFDLVFSLEGDEVKRIYNPSLQRDEYRVAERYGLWLCKDYIPIERMNDWIARKGEFTKYHAFLNCQAFELTANRGSIKNTPKDILDDLQKSVIQLFEEKIKKDRAFLTFLEAEEEEEMQLTEKQEADDFAKREKKARKKKSLLVKGATLWIPENEAETIAFFSMVRVLEPDLFRYLPIDHNTRTGYDSVARLRDELDIARAQLNFLEFKYNLKPTLNHSFKSLHSLICWNCDLPDKTEVYDCTRTKRLLHIVPPGPENTSKITKHFLRIPEGSPYAPDIDVIVLNQYLEECGFLSQPKEKVQPKDKPKKKS